MVRKHIKYIIILLFFLAIASGIYIYKQRTTISSAQNQVLNTTPVKKGDIKIRFSDDGESYLPVLKLRFQISGQLKEVNVNIGDKIKKGDILAKLDDSDYINKLDTARLNYDQALTKLEKTKQDYEQQLASEKAKVDNFKYQFDNISIQYLPMMQIEDAYAALDIEAKRLAYENAKNAYESELHQYNTLSSGSPDIKLDEINIEQSKLAVKAAQDALDNTILKAPDDGEILYVSNMVGETVSNSTTNSTGTDFITMADRSKLSVTANVPEEDLPNVKVGQVAEIEFEAFQGQIFKGTVLSIEPLPVTDSTGLITYTVNVDFKNPEEQKIESGMSCSVSFIQTQRTNILIMPNSSVKRVDGKQVVEVKDESGSIITKNIKTGLTDVKNVEVVEGLKEGEKIVIKDNK